MGDRCLQAQVIGLLDTNILVRHVTGEPSHQAQRATSLLAHAGPGELILADLIAAELVYVLQSVYKLPRSHVASILRSLLALPAIQCEQAQRLHRTVELYADGQDFADAYLLATAEIGGIPTIISFDRGIPDFPNIHRIEP